MAWGFAATDVLVDPRSGSGDLVRPLQALGIPARYPDPRAGEGCELEFGDVQLVGRGANDRPVLVGVEVKTLSDVLQCIVDRRFSGHQLPGLLASYEERWLLIEGVMLCDKTRELYIARVDHRPPIRAAKGEKPWQYEAVQSWRRSVERAGCKTDNVPDRRSVVAWIASLYHWWQKAPEDHQAMFGVRLKDLSCAGDPIADYIAEASPKMRVAASVISGVGSIKAAAAAAHFRSIRKMANAEVEAWREVPGFGKRLADAMVEEIVRES